MTVTAHITPKREASLAARRAGYVIAVVLNAVLSFLVNRWPGWDAVPFLTQDTEQVLGIVNASIVASLVANLVYLVRDPPRLKAIGDVVTTSIALASAVRIWQVYPFDFATGGFDWDLLARIVLVVAIVGTAIGIVVALVRFATGTRG